MSRFLQALARRTLVFDGAMGTSIHALDLSLERDFLGKENCSEVLVRTRPDAIQKIHESFLAVGADAVETDTFGASKLVLAEFDLADQTYALNRQAAQIARAACDRYSTSDRPRFVVGSIGPGTKLVTLGNTTWEVMLDSYREQVRGLLDGGADVLLIETAQDLLQVKCAVNAALQALDERGRRPAVPRRDAAGRWSVDPAASPDDVPIMVQVTIETTGTMLLGTEIQAAAVALAGYPIASLGMNCATGPVEMSENVHWLGRHWDRPVSVLPNAGLPVLVEGRTEYPLKPVPFASALVRFVREAGIQIVGGCCGTTPTHIGELVRAIEAESPSPVVTPKAPLRPSCSSLYSPVEYRQDNSLLMVGERTNASGSRAFKRLLETEDWDGIVSLAREQVREGSHVIDINVDYAGRDNAADMALVVEKIVRQVNVPLMLDSTQPATLEAGLRRAGGKCILNSANLEDGEEKFARLCELARRYQAGLVLGTIDEDPQEAMARTADRKLAIAARMFELATKQHGLTASDLFFDPLVLPISTGMDKDRRSALETIEGTRRIAQAFPDCHITCGLSNVSFGLKPAARQALNSVFLHELTEAGLTSAILHVSKILPRNRIADDLWHAALDLIYDRREKGDPLQRFIDLFPDSAAEASGARQQTSALTLEERLQRHIIDGEKRDLLQTLQEARARYTPLAIINDHLLAGMKVVGDLFGSGQMQLPFVLQSAEVMKMAVGHLEQYMEKSAATGKGSIVLATVKGDVHDIGKNLVDIILSNNGYTVHNLGIKQPISAILEKWRQTGADAIGLSGLLVKSVNVMEENLHELNAQGVSVPVLLGGAALSKHYCDSHLRSIYRGKVYHGRDAFEGLRIMDHLASKQLAELDTEIEERLAKRAEVEARLATAAAAESSRSPSVEGDVSSPAAAAAASPLPSDIRNQRSAIPPAPFLGARVIDHVPLEAIYPFINTVALFRGQWQFKKGALTDEEFLTQVRDEVRPIFEELKARCRDEKVLEPRVVYGYFPCNSGEGEHANDLILYDPADPDREIERFTFPRQSGRKRLCISDFFRPVSDGQRDVIGLSCVTMGHEVSRRARALFSENRYTDYLYLHGFGVECAEALAELWHKRMRQELGIDADDSPDVRGLFTQQYRGSRYSFGYPACPDMSDQAKLFRLLDPARIGCELTENWQIDPEQSTSAIVVHHPAAKYFNI